ncbi:hypothetical protein GX50_03442 [[Emmonsia] crescens]|uniref:Uncharacterized protein n=1 Tax=[Emmonsia] crescens TaxID=73230 RepID=A0A2B7ZB71_9EURO|nr:hypothetical protein GX50_03442 [Emmonsia crescens]
MGSQVRKRAVPSSPQCVRLISTLTRIDYITLDLIHVNTLLPVSPTRLTLTGARALGIQLFLCIESPHPYCTSYNLAKNRRAHYDIWKITLLMEGYAALALVTELKASSWEGSLEC